MVEIPKGLIVQNPYLVEVKVIATRDKEKQINGFVYPLVNVHEPETLPIEQVYITTCYPGSIKGPHCHTGNKTDRFYCIQGITNIVCRNEQTKRYNTYTLTDLQQQYLVIPPYNSHAIQPLSKEVCIIVSMPNEGYKEDQPYNQIETEYDSYIWSSTI